MDEEPIPLATYATILAHLVSPPGQPLDKVLGALGVTREQLEKADAYFNERLRESHRLRKGILAMSFAAAFGEARKAQGLFTSEPSLPVIGGHGGAEPSALPSYMTAAPPVSVGTSAWSSAPVGAPQVAPPQLTPVAPAHVPVGAPPVTAPAHVGPPAAVPAPPPPSLSGAALLSTTSEIMIMKGPPSAMPFRPVSPGPAAPAAPPAATAVPAVLGSVTTPSATGSSATAHPAPGGLGTGTQLGSSDAPRLADTPWDQVASRVGKLTLAHYAALTIELSRSPPDLAPILQRYGLSSQDDLRHVNAAFQAQMQFDPSLRAQFDGLIGRMRSMSSRRDST